MEQGASLQPGPRLSEEYNVGRCIKGIDVSGWTKWVKEAV